MTTATTTTTLPALTGSEKQIAWATDIRERKLAEIGEFVAAALQAPAKPGATPEQVEASRATIRKLQRGVSRQAKAAYWIENRDRRPAYMLGEMQKVYAAASR